MTLLKVGDTIWRFDINRRKYDKPGIGGHTIYREHFEPHEIGGETKQSWLITDGYGIVKVNKKTLYEAGGRYVGHQWYTRGSMEDAVWAHEHKQKIFALVERASITLLRSIADVVGYNHKSQ